MSLVPRTFVGQWRWFVALWLALGGAAVFAAGGLAGRDAEAQAQRQASVAAALHAAILRSELERHRSLPMVLARDPDLAAMLAAPTAADTDRVDRRFESLAGDVRAAAIYVLNDRGVAVAASNWRLPTSFVGSDYRFRPYFHEAMREGQAAFFALGTVSGRPGLYLSRRVDDARARRLGVIVAKVEFDALEDDWRTSGETTYVTDANGIVLITTTPAWRFRATRPLSAGVRRRLAASQTSGRAALDDLPFTATSPGLVRIAAGAPPDLYAHAAEPIPGMGWTLHLLSPSGEAVSRAVFGARAVALLSIALLAGLSGILLRRRQRSLTQAVEAEAARQDLERQIDLRTTELRTANVRLSHEIDERRRLEISRQDLQDELIQANKLATLGQIAAGVAHEINQPIAAIRTHAANASLHLGRKDGEAAGRSLGAIAGLTERIGAITDELRAFSRKTRSEMVAVSVDAAIDGALLLVGPRLRERGIALTRQGDSPGVRVKAERNRLEQVVLNLLQNAAEALDGVSGARIDISVDALAGRKVAIRIADTGPGVSPDVLGRLFTHFTTDKRDGLGLGLVISRDIVAGFGGELVHEPSPTGAVFKIILAKAR